MAREPVVVTALKNGKKEGRAQLGKEILTYLEGKYLSKEVTRGSEYGNDILELAAELSKLIKGELGA